MDQARELAEQLPDVSASVLQRRLHVGFQRAVELRRQLEEEGVVAAAPHP